MRIIILLVLMSVLIIACGSPAAVDTDETPGLTITVSVLPQRYFVRRIVGDRFDVDVMIPPGHNPATYAPTPRQMQALSRSRLYFRIGYIPFEKAWLKTIAANNPRMKIVDTSVGVDLIKGDSMEEEHHPHRHHHGGIDPHIWLSPRAVKIQVKHMLDALVKMDGKNREFFQTNYREFLRDIEKLDREIKVSLESCRGRKFMVFHPAWSYFAREYGLVQIPIEMEGKNPTPGELKKTIDLAKAEDIQVIFVQKQFDNHNARAVAEEIAGQVVFMDPLAEDWLANMQRIAQTLRHALLSSSPGSDVQESARKVIPGVEQRFAALRLAARSPGVAGRWCD
jgi:zinc transport system substrate-binding protein